MRARDLSGFGPVGTNGPQPVDVLAVMDETIRKTEQAVPTPLKRYGESCEHPVHHASRAHDLREARAAVAELIEAARDVSDWLIRNNLGGTAHQLHLAEKVAHCGATP